MTCWHEEESKEERARKKKEREKQIARDQGRRDIDPNTGQYYASGEQAAGRNRQQNGHRPWQEVIQSELERVCVFGLQRRC